MTLCFAKLYQFAAVTDLTVGGRQQGQVPLKPFSKIKKPGPSTRRIKGKEKRKGRKRNKKKKEEREKKNQNVTYGSQGWHTFYTFVHMSNSGCNYHPDFILHLHIWLES